MGKESKNQALGKVYREFSRQKYNKYKAQFPKLREPQIVNKIIKEWDSLDLAAKEHLQKLYEEKKFLTNQDISSSQALKRTDRASKEARVAAERSAKKKAASAVLSATRLHSNIRQVEGDDSDFKRGSDVKDDSRVVESSSPAVFIDKTKQIGKSSQSDYISFFKKYYNSLSQEHSRWTTQQISSVIKLLWKKKKNQGKSLRKSDRKLRTSKPLSGKRYFRRVRHLDGTEAKIKWRLLPHEGKTYWDHEAKGIEIDNTNVEGKLHLRPPGIINQSVNKFSFLNKVAL